MSKSYMHELALSSVEYADSYLKILQYGIESNKPRFNNELLFQMAAICVEKYLVGLLARYYQTATHHTPTALFKEVRAIDPLLTDEMKHTAILVGQFDSICAFDSNGYSIPGREELQEMYFGIREIKKVVDQRIKEIEPGGQGG